MKNTYYNITGEAVRLTGKRLTTKDNFKYYQFEYVDGTKGLAPEKHLDCFLSKEKRKHLDSLEWVEMEKHYKGLSA